ncbi:uncharacterized protein LOC133213728 isoform X2 [Neopsephotus bourkii]|uniref:uncharacterized protein LOC133213728 isoform X2 n=1 Tax=Neopsephotus bourkii TaxID=309878 RepID=UPI002AA59691|nr:uncharacterized protein LOC133213728 isoform X2 [Neopsephotus bourkii]
MPGGQQQKHAELGPPWTMEYFPIRSCHFVFQNGSGMFYLPLHADIKTNIWCNWTIWAGPQKHIVIYVQGFHGSDGCGKNQDKIVFQGISSSVETKVVYACQNRGTLIFATQAAAVHVLFLSGSGSLRHEYTSFKGQYYVFRDSETMGTSNDAIATREPIQETSKKEGWKTAVTKGLLPMLRASASPSPIPVGGRTQPELVSTDEETQHSPDLMEDAQYGANLNLASALASLENSTALQSQHHPGDVLFEVTIEIKPKDWIPHGGSELQKDLLESMRNYIQENLKLPANRVNEIKLKEIKRMSNANLLLTFWLHLKPEERNMSLLLHSQLEDLLGSSAGAEKLHLVSLFVEDVNECTAGVGLCGEEAECFNGVGTYLCRCKKNYEDHSPTKSGTLCIPAAQSGISLFLRHADILVGAAITAALSMLVAAGVLCRAAMRGRHPRRSLSPEEPPVRAAEEPVMELHDLGQCLHLDPFQLKLRARPPEWLWAARVHPAQEYQGFLEQSPQL